MSLPIARAASAADVVALARQLYGEDRPMGPLAGTGHVVAVWRDPQGGSWVMRIGAGTPRSDHDRLALGLARARAGAIVVTGRILRDEPSLRYDLTGPGTLESALLAYRDELTGLADPPELLVLTSGHGLSPDHPVWASWARPLVLTTREAAEALRARLPSRVTVIGAERPSLRGALRLLREERGHRGVLVEAGPSTALDLYVEPFAVDELLLSIFEGSTLADGVQGGRFLTEEEIAKHLVVTGTGLRVDEPDGSWSFRRFVAPGPAR